jgi:exopolysaccharide biosynthesis polyprenyl glycosylphosphotransferase
LAYLGSYWLRSLTPNSLPEIRVYLAFAAANGLVLLVIFSLLGLYRPSLRASRFNETTSVLFGLGLAVALVLVGAFFVRSVSLSRLVIAYTLPLAGFGLISGRLGLRALNDWARIYGYGVKAVLVLGTSTQAQQLGGRLARNPGLGYRLVGYLGEQGDLGELADLERVLGQNPVEEVWFALGEIPRSELATLLQVIQHQGNIQIRFMPTVVELMTTGLEVESLGGVPLLSLRATPLGIWSNRFLKRLFDIGLSSLGLLLISPLLLLLALLVRFSSPGPILYRQERLSRDGQLFYIYKFRSMRTDAEVNGPGWTRPNDDRVTAVGRVLRRTSLDELPQLLNVLLGDMSLVGPRPERPYFVQQFQQDIPKYVDRHLVKTGITGWAQIHGLRGDTSIPERVRYDLYYIENWSLLMDLRILLMTTWQLFRGQFNAY